MVYPSHPTEQPRVPNGIFATTQWSVVVQAGDGQSPEAGFALERLCQTYWYPLYAYVRRRGYNPHEAQDLTQAFFERMLEKSFLRAVDRSKGKFRSFLIAAFFSIVGEPSTNAIRARASNRSHGRYFYRQKHVLPVS